MGFFSPTPTLLPNGSNLWYGDSVPSASTDGTYQAGDFLWITNPAAGGATIWKCTVAGAPGTWVEDGASGLESNGSIRLASERLMPQQKVVTFNLCANGSLGTQTFFIADQAYTVTGIKYVHKTAGTVSTAACSVTKDTSTQAPGTGLALQVGTFACYGTATNTVLSATLATTASTLVLAAGDRLAVLFAGTLTTLAGVVISVYLTPANVSETAVYYANVNADIKTQTFFIANRDMIVTGVQAIYKTKFVAAATLDVTHETSTTQAGGGTSILSAAMAADGTNSTVITPALAASAATLTLAAGDRLSVKFSATTTGVGVCVVVSFKPIFQRAEVTWQLGIGSQQSVAQCFFIADRDYEVIDASTIYDVTAGTAATIGVTIDKGTTVPGGGNAIATGTFDENTTARTVIIATLNTIRNRLLSAGDRLGLVVTGGAYNTVLNCITVSLKPV